MLRFVAMAVMCMAVAEFSYSQLFSLDVSSTNIPGLLWGSAAWADCDNDNDLDLLLCGQMSNFTNVTRVYLNNAGQFSLAPSNMLGISEGEVKWGDYDNDGDLDPIASSGLSTRLYRNNHPITSFSTAFGGFPLAYNASLSWGDYDNDGDNDLALSGDLGTQGTSYMDVFRNDQGTFVKDTSVHFPSILGGDCDWVDFDVDGDLDLSIAGYDEDSMAARFTLFLNSGGQFTEMATNVPGISVQNSEWADYDSDGDMDLMLAGLDASGNAVTLVYKNNAGLLTLLNGMAIFPAENGFASWIDDDNDGDHDILITSLYGSRVARNNFGFFTNINSGLPSVMAFVAQAIGDYDGDHDLDVVVSYSYGNNQRVTSLYSNETQNSNSSPESPGNLQATVVNNQEIQFTWDAAFDAQTPSPGLSYRMWIGSSPTDFDVLAPVSDTATGYLRLPEPGPIKGTAWTLKVPAVTQTYHACVQAIDGGLEGSLCSNQVSALVVATEQARPVVVTAGPNPTSGHIRVRAADTELGSIGYQFLDLQGRLMGQLRGEFQGDIELDLSSLPAGTYLLQLTGDGWPQAQTIKVVRQ